MRLIKQNNKLLLYDDISDKYYPIEPDDLEHIMDEDNKLLSDDTIEKYFKFKYNRFKVNKKGYTSKKIDLKNIYKTDMETTQKNYIINKFLNDISGLSELDRMAFIKNPSINTIKRFSIDDETKKRLIEKFEELHKSYVTIKDNGDDIQDMLDYFIYNKVNVSIPQAVKEAISSKIHKFLNDESYTANDLLEYIRINKDKFNNPKKPNNYNDFIAFIEKEIIPLKTKTKFDKEEVNEVINKTLSEVIPSDIKTPLINSDFINEDEFKEASILNNNNNFIPSKIFKTSHINKYKESFFGNNAKTYRVLKYLYESDKIDEINKEDTEDKDIKKVTITLKDDIGDVILYIDTKQYLGNQLNENYNKTESFKDDSLFNGIDTIKNLETFKTPASTLKSFEFIRNPEGEVFNYNLDDEDVKEILKTITLDINANEFEQFLNFYYENYESEDEPYIKPTKVFESNKNKFKYKNYYDTVFSDSSKVDEKNYYSDLFKVLPKSITGKDITTEDIRQMGIRYINWNLKENKNHEEALKKDEDYKSQLKTYEDYFKTLKGKAKTEGKNIKDIPEFNDKYENYNKLKDEYNEFKDNNLMYLDDWKEEEHEYKLPLDETFKKLNIDFEDEDTVKKYEELFKDYFNNVLLNNYYYISTPSVLTTKNKPQMTNIQDDFKNYMKLKKYDDNVYYNLKRELESKGIENKGIENYGGNWSYNILKKIEKLQQDINKINKISSGSWSYNVLKKIDYLKDKINNIN